MRTERLYYDDCYLKNFTATVLGVEAGGGIVLDRSAFYPESGGQAHDLGTLNGYPLERVIESGGGVLHYLAGFADAAAGLMPFEAGETVRGEMDWERRFDLMQHHTGQHLLSAVAVQLYGWKTESVHMGAANATVELRAGSAGETAFNANTLARLEEEVNRRIQMNLAVSIATHATAQGLAPRKAVEREGPVRLVSIGDLDLSACGGTHVRATGEIGCLFLGRAEKIRGNTRVEFACGQRAVREARRRSGLLSEAAAVFQAAPERIAALAAAQREELAATAKRLRVLEAQHAEMEGRDARRSVKDGVENVCCAVRWVESIGDAERAFARGFCGEAGPAPNRSILLTMARGTGAFLVEASPDAGFDAKAWVAEAARTAGVKGGGAAFSASGRTPDLECARALIGMLPSRAVELPR